MKTSSELLSELISLEFEASVIASTPNILRKLLIDRSQVIELRNRYDSGSLTDEQVQVFVNSLLEADQTPKRFPYQAALAALAVMFESRYSKFAQEFMEGLASVRASSFSMAAGVARECLAVRPIQTAGKCFFLSDIACQADARLIPEYGRTTCTSGTERGLAA